MTLAQCLQMTNFAHLPNLLPTVGSIVSNVLNQINHANASVMLTVHIHTIRWTNVSPPDLRIITILNSLKKECSKLFVNAWYIYILEAINILLHHKPTGIPIVKSDVSINLLARYWYQFKILLLVNVIYSHRC